MSTFKTLIAMLAIVLPITASAQGTEGSDSSAPRGRHEIELNIGFLSALSASNDVRVGSLEMTSEADGIIRSMTYGYRFASEWAATLSIGVASADARMSVSGSGVFTESAAVIPVLLGVKYEPLKLAIADALRPYLYASLGPYFGHASDVRAGPSTGAESYVETALGSRVGVGMNLWLGKRFGLGFAAGYRLVSDFGRRVGSEENHSSPEFSLSFGLNLGTGID